MTVPDRTTDRSRRILSSPRALCVSDLDNNEIRNVGLITFAAPLRLLTDLKVLSLNGNRFNEVGIGTVGGARSASR